MEGQRLGTGIIGESQSWMGIVVLLYSKAKVTPLHLTKKPCRGTEDPNSIPRAHTE